MTIWLTILGVALLVTPSARAQSSGTEPPAPTTPAAAPVVPLPPAVAPNSPGMAPPPAAAPPALAADGNGAAVPPAPADQDRPIFERWWFWTALGAFAVTAVVIVAASSGPSTPRTDLGNMPAF